MAEGGACASKSRSGFLPFRENRGFFGFDHGGIAGARIAPCPRCSPRMSICRRARAHRDRQSSLNLRFRQFEVGNEGKNFFAARRRGSFFFFFSSFSYFFFFFFFFVGVFFWGGGHGMRIPWVEVITTAYATRPLQLAAATQKNDSPFSAFRAGKLRYFNRASIFSRRNPCGKHHTSV